MAVKRAGPVAAVAVTGLLDAASWGAWFAGGLSVADAAGAYLLTNTAMSVTFTAFGALVLAHRPRHRIGLLFVAYGACYTVSVACLGLLSGVFALSPGWERAVDLVGITVWIPAPVVCLPLILQLFPDGHPLSPRWRPLAAVTLALALLAPAVTLRPGGDAGDPTADHSPLLPAAVGRVAEALVPVFVAAAALVLLGSLVALGLRARRSGGAERLQVMWLLWAVVLFVVLNLQRIVTTDGPVLFLLTLPLVPAAATVAIVRHQLYDIRLIVNRSLVYGLLTVGVVGAYLGIVAGLAPLAREWLSASPLVATGVIAVTFAPARSALQSFVDRLMYGRRRDPAEAAARVGARLATGLDGVLNAVCEALRLPYAAVRSDGRLIAACGSPTPAWHVVALEVAEGEKADLLVGLRAGEARLSTVDRRALDLLAAPVGLALQAVRLSERLRESRRHIVAAREEERRRLRRDLHDGLGSALAAVTLKADAAHNLLRSDPEHCGRLLLDLRDDLADAIADIRRLVYDLRPPDLDELGLAGALRQRAQQSWRRDQAGFVVTVDIPDDLPSLPAAVEVAAYRIATEAVTNALRHSRANTCEVSLRADGALHLEIRDNGADASGAWSHGVGLRSMRERAAELGGTLTAGPTNQGGLVHALLPLEGV
ncbi:sensor histidine kinase [Microtetraspora malaysiensis]|uniref:sensor histidine kinase n=1 Tax=Microtetraspora malaysiensis TaxID=161358 RepID=UPI000831D1FF|nr:sensor histidine kinase [Microtetraspora malaysiensis]